MTPETPTQKEVRRVLNQRRYNRDKERTGTAQQVRLTDGQKDTLALIGADTLENNGAIIRRLIAEEGKRIDRRKKREAKQK